MKRIIIFVVAMVATMVAAAQQQRQNSDVVVVINDECITIQPANGQRLPEMNSRQVECLVVEHLRALERKVEASAKGPDPDILYYVDENHQTYRIEVRINRKNNQYENDR